MRTDTDLPLGVVVLGARRAHRHSVAALPQIPVNAVGARPDRVFSFFFVTVTSRIVGRRRELLESRVRDDHRDAPRHEPRLPCHGLDGPGGMIAAVSVGSVVCIAICSAGDISQDLKTGFLVGATPWRQQIGEIIGVLTSAA